LCHADGNFTKDQQEISHLARDFYSNLYTSEATWGVEEVLASVLVSVTHAMNEHLIEPFEEGEVKAALFQMFSLKALGPDGYLAQFFSKALGFVWR
jgi:hypothetical protein